MVGGELPHSNKINIALVLRLEHLDLVEVEEEDAGGLGLLLVATLELADHVAEAGQVHREARRRLRWTD